MTRQIINPWSWQDHAGFVETDGDEAVIEYELYDEDGLLLYGPVTAALDGGWWRTFRPLVAAYG